jgi:putative PIN family toxin of toxin-antitoxin system
VRAYIERRFTAVASRELLSELAEVVARPRLSIRASTWVTDASALLGLIGREPLIQITNASYGCRDPKDDAVIETAILGQVQYLVTGDQDLLDPIVVVTLNANGILLTTARALVAKITI